MRNHLERLTRLVLEAARPGRERWTQEEHRVHGHHPDEVRQTLRQDLLLTQPCDYLSECAAKVSEMLRDPLLSPDAWKAITGDSQLRPRTLYPN